jgi:hypothetical protein
MSFFQNRLLAGGLRYGGASPEVYDLDIEVCKSGKAKALAAFMTQTHDFGGVIVHVKVLGPKGNVEPKGSVPTNPEEAGRLVERALGSNRFFVQIDGPKFLAQLYIEFKKAVLQYFADNISDFYQNNNEVAALAFADVLQLDAINGIRIGVTTSPKK